MWSNMAMDTTADLSGKRIVVVEDDFLLANDICRELRNLGATVLGPAPTPFYASQLIARGRIDAAVLDVRLHGTTVFEVADQLRGRGVPILFATAYDRQAIPPRFQDACLLQKPLDRKRLVSEVVAMTTRQKAPTVSVPRTQAPLDLQQSPPQAFARALARTLLISGSGQKVTSIEAGKSRQFG
jgi:DNA-binding response OmpR family regulator